jgi:hypothetical protein
MSGPITVVITANPAAALVAASAIRAVEAINEGYERAAALQDKQNKAMDARREMQSGAIAEGQAVQEKNMARLEARFDTLLELAGQVGLSDPLAAARPSRTSSGDEVSLGAYAQGLEQMIREIESIVMTEAARQQKDLENLPEALAQAAPLPTRPGGVSRRLLARIAHLGDLPEDLLALARELDETLPGQRAELLATELRARIQAHAEAAQQRELGQATQAIVTRSLKDMGYQVEEVAETLFVEGGVMHFRRPGWGDYQVRMRLDPKAATANFNVARAVDGGSTERSALDHLAEDRWCAEFPALLKALERQGVHLNVTRRLAAGELPVQLVAREKLPHFADEEAVACHHAPLAREIK